jgi:hypothetical protein
MQEQKLKAADASVTALRISAVPGRDQRGVRELQAEIFDVILAGVAML